MCIKADALLRAYGEELNKFRLISVTFHKNGKGFTAKRIKASEKNKQEKK